LTEIDISDLSQLSEEAIETLQQRSTKALLKGRDPMTLATILVRAAKILEQKASYESAHKALTSALTLRIKAGASNESIAGTYYRLSELACRREDFSKAMRYARLAKAYLEAGSHRA